MKIKDVIKDRGLTVATVAKRMGVDPPALSRVIHGNPTVKMIERIADAIGVSASELFADQPPPLLRCPRCGAELEVFEKK